ncbi:unnamed protein product [Dibothriocephalus latus]|uniref:Uncharacterized protein n=1 Tax=Dibothriocephalus latus TaxID=60516 RepID=A0A3P7LIK4_DIBLA|nr:unnamed protein product [Dibothriocephalus latus]
MKIFFQWLSTAQAYIDAVPERFKKATLKSLLEPDLMYKADGPIPSPFFFTEYLNAIERIFQSRKSSFSRNQLEGENFRNFHIALKHLYFLAFPPHGGKALSFNRLISGIRNRELAIICTSRPPTNANEALDLNAMRRDRFLLAQEPRTTMPTTSRGHLLVLLVPSRPPYSNPFFNRPPSKPQTTRTNVDCSYCERHYFLPKSKYPILLEDDTVTTELNSVEASTFPSAKPSSTEEIMLDNIPMSDRRAA